VQADLVIADDVFERDNWVCHLCGDPIPERLRVASFRAGVYEPLYPVVDHIIPLSKLGPHTMDNCATAHWTCNSQKYISEGLGEPELVQHTVAPSFTGRPACSVEQCVEQAYIKGMCRRHYIRDLRLGHPLNMKCGCGCGEIVQVDATWTGLFYIDGHGVQYGTTDPAEKLRQSIVPQPVTDRGRDLYGLTDDCLIWTGTSNKQHYGVINFRISKGVSRVELVHRFAYELANGVSSASRLSVDHLCGVSLCCNPNHLEAVTLAENISRAALAITECPQGHPYDEKNTLYSGDDGYRVCRQCNRNGYHIKKRGHEFVSDPENPSTKRERCLTCRLEAEATPQFCPQGHEYTPENKQIKADGKRYCLQCMLNRRHIEQYGHEFVIDESNPSEKRRRCLVCVQAAAPITHCMHGHEYTELTLEFSRKGHRKCVQCRLDKAHVPQYGHEYAIDPSYKPGNQRRCMICTANAPVVTHCVNGHEYTPENTKHHKTRGNRICVTCETNGFHVPKYGHEFVTDPNHHGKLRRCLVCAENKLK
jgi:hypothetical protein